LSDGGSPVRVWTLRVDDVSEARANGWRGFLNDSENAQADRFVFARDRVQYLAAHALTRHALSSLLPGTPPHAWQFVPASNGKPDAWLGGRRAPVSFNLSHTNGLVGVAAAARSAMRIGFDLETLHRNVPLEVVDRYFRPEEADWLVSLPEDERPYGFLRLWTLKEAFIKATGEGLSRDLASFWFDMGPRSIRFVPENTLCAAAWHFQQWVVAERFVVAVGLHDSHSALSVLWHEVNPDQGTGRDWLGT
jgi:4'-phosphopantetheinyl transferase